jgi:hypothetical protein
MHSRPTKFANEHNNFICISGLDGDITSFVVRHWHWHFPVAFVRRTRLRIRRARYSYLTRNSLASPSNTSISPVIKGISKRLRPCSILCCGIPATRTCFFNRVVHSVGKSFPLRTKSVHCRARSLDLSLDISLPPSSDEYYTRGPAAFDLDQCSLSNCAWRYCS